MIQLLAKPVVEKVQGQVKSRVSAFVDKHRRKPKLVVVLVGEDPGSVIYTRRKGEAAVFVGMDHATIQFPGTATPHEVQAAVKRLNDDPGVDGILIQRPLPATFREEEVLYWVAPEKDVDAFHPITAGKLVLGMPAFAPCTPAGIIELLAHYNIDPAGKLACVIGRSSIVGKPMGSLLLQKNATLLHCHSKTADLASISAQADIVIAAVGKAEMIQAKHVKPGAVVIDVGINRLTTGKIVGDVAYAEVSEKASAITPVPGGVGPMTIAMLLQNTIWAAELNA